MTGRVFWMGKPTEQVHTQESDRKHVFWRMTRLPLGKLNQELNKGYTIQAQLHLLLNVISGIKWDS